MMRTVLTKRGRVLPKGLPKGAKRCTPIFSDIDVDLRNRKWRLNRYGYPVSQINGYASRLGHREVLQRMLGRELIPAELGDHINGDRLDLRRCNLRLTDRNGNAQNRTTVYSASGYRGVCWNHSSRKWQAQVQYCRKTHYCGVFATAKEAAMAAAAKRRELGFLGSEVTP